MSCTRMLFNLHKVYYVCHVDAAQHLHVCGTELLMTQGAIYATDNGAYSWSAAVQETVDATLNRTVSSGISGASYYEGTFSTIQRSPAGDYVAVSSRGDILSLRSCMRFVTCMCQAHKTSSSTH